MTGLNHQRISNMAACLVALMITLPALPVSACACGPASPLQKLGERTHAASTPIARKACCNSRPATTSKNVRPCCCSPISSGGDLGQCKCGPSCTCSQDQVPDPPAVPVNQGSTSGKQVTAAQAATFANSPFGQAETSGAQTQRPHGGLAARATSLERCILLSCFAL